MTVKFLVVTLATAALVIGGEFRTIFNKSESVTLFVPRPADVALAAKALDIKAGPAQAPANRVMQLGQRIQADLAKQFEMTNKKPDATVEFSVISYEPVKIENQTVTENRSINVGSDKKPDFETRSVPVVYQLIHGSATISVTVVDSSGAIVDQFKQDQIVARRKELTVNGKASDQTEEQSAAEQSKARPNSIGGILTLPAANRKQSHEGHETPVVETSEDIEQGMLQALAEKVAHRYVASTQKVEIALAVDAELRQGDKLAESGQWKEALDSWTKATMKKNPSDRLYNMAVAGEALAYAQYAQDNDLSALLEKFRQAMDLYTQALHGDPNEKYMRDSVDRLQLAKTNVETARRMKVEQDLAAEAAVKKASDLAQKRNMQEAAVEDRRPDTATEATFRQSVRVQLRAVSGAVPDAQRDHLVAFGERLKLSEIESYRVVEQEIKRHSELTQALQDYEDTFRPLAADGRITVTERTQLNNLAKQEGLDPADVKSVESKYHFTEDAPRSPRAQNSARGLPVNQ